MAPSITLQDFDAVLFDLDGVLTTTRPSTRRRGSGRSTSSWRTGTPATARRTEPFDDHADYAAHVDGKPRQDGVRDFLAARGIELPEGGPDDAPDQETVWGLGNRKQLLVEDELQHTGVEVFPGSVAWVRELREAGLRTAVVSSSRNCAAVLDITRASPTCSTPGSTATRRWSWGCPASRRPTRSWKPPSASASRPQRAIVVEDALAGVEAGRAGGFGLVIGVDRDGHAAELAEHGADVVVADLGELLAAPTEQRHRAGPREHRLVAAARRIIAATGDYPADQWRLVEASYNPDYVEQTETLFALSNGFLGIRGVVRGGRAVVPPGDAAQRLPRDLADRVPGDGATASPRPARRSCPFPTARRSASSSTRTRSPARRRRSASFERALDMRTGRARPRRSCTSWRTAAGSGSRRSGSCRWRSGTWRASGTR